MAPVASPPSLTTSQIAHLADDRGPALIATCGFFIALCATVVGLRFAARLSRNMKPGLDDWLSASALIFVVLYAVTTILAVQYGLGKHIWAVNPATAYKIIEIGLYNAVVYVIVNFLVKTSILLFYRRIFTLNIIWFRYAIYSCFVYTTGWFLGTLFGAIFQCSPVSFFWTKTNPFLTPAPVGTCPVNGPGLVISSSALNSVGDIVILSLPLIMMGQLQLPQAKKIALGLVFATGALAIAAGLTRLAESVSVTKENADATWITANIYLWTMIEAGVGLITSCLPIIGPFFGLLKDKAQSYISSRMGSKKLIDSGMDRSVSKDYTQPSMDDSRLFMIDGGNANEPQSELTSSDNGILRTDEFDMQTLRGNEKK